MTNKNEIFDKAFIRLNEAQKKAVEAIYGPVMVIAGPGTGKTQIISLRTANIILKTGADPRNILITTFTEAGVIAIKKRLFDFIGTESYKVNVSTIHSFCNDVIQMFPEKFLEYRAFRSLDDIEQLEIFESILDSGKYEALSSDYDKYFYVRTIKDKISKLKQEGITPEVFDKIIEDQKKDYEEQLDNIDQKLKKYASEKERFEKHIKKLEELNVIYDQYLTICNKRGVYDFSDMIDFVLRKMQTDENLRIHYAEKYQFIMVDEYQDTNNAQNSIVDLILSMSDEKNIMVVGDDDQSIYRFQGANLENMLYFSQKYEDTKFVVLSENYRSTQEILDLATRSIGNNASRITNFIKGLDKSLHSNRNESTTIGFFGLPSEVEEKALVLENVTALAQEGLKPEEIAIIVRTNKEVETWTDLLQTNSFEVISKLNSNILDSNHVKMLLGIIQIIKDPYSDEARVADLLRSGIWNISRTDVLKMLRRLNSINYVRKNKMKIFDFITDAEELTSLFGQKIDGNQGSLFDMASGENNEKESSSMEGLKDFLDSILECQSKMNNDFHSFFKFVLERLDYVEYVKRTGNFNDMQDVYTLLEVVRSWVIADKDLDVDGFLRRIGYHEKYSISMPRQVLGSKESGINVLTAHQSKGLEYDAVFVPGLTHGNWGARRVVDHLKLPYGVIGSTVSESISGSDADEEERRLFFVAITRARKHLSLSFAAGSGTKPKLQSQFLQELHTNLEIKNMNVDGFVINELTSKISLEKLHKQEELYIQEFLKHYKLSPSDLNKFIEDPKLFLRDTIFKYPFEDNEFTIFGKVYHKTLEYFYLDYKKTGIISDLKHVQNRFMALLRQEILSPEEFSRLEKKGLEGLAGWHDMNAPNIRMPVELEYDFRPRNIVLDDIPLTGKIDKIEELGGSEVRLVDYKTGRAKTTNEIIGGTQNSDGKYYRQLLFYKIMFELDKNLSARYSVSDLTIEFVEGKDGRYPVVTVPHTQEDIDRVKDEIREAWAKINDMDFWRSLI